MGAGYKGKTAMAKGAFYAPYIPLIKLHNLEYKVYDIPGWYIVKLDIGSNPSIELQNQAEYWKRDSFKFGGKYVGRDLYFPTNEVREQFLSWQLLKQPPQ